MHKIKNTIAENFGGAASELGSRQFKLDDCPDLSGKVAVVTGGSEGIGFAVAYTLLKHNLSKLYIISVSRDVANGAKGVLVKELGQSAADRTIWMECDLADWFRVKDVAEAIKRVNERLDILVNNAGRGIMTAELTPLGVDRHMAVNHIGHVVLTSHLLPLLRRTAEQGSIVRISNQASNLHNKAPSNTKFASLDEINTDVGSNGQYARSKLAVLLYARYFARKVTKNGYPNVLMNATHPGFVSSKQSRKDIFEPFPAGGYAMSHGIEPFKKDQFEGSVPTVYAATVTNDSGQYICPPAIPEEGSAQSQSEELAERLMELTRNIVREKTRSESVEKGCPFDDLVLH
ncbi:hypothetical protein C8A03DRAFT_34786 [Achaetomium macrosporum]|uniref:Retinol dehydrogenase 12 n=1 Tax=Achaetomium macrosporum TaxID=79813 RepID=A0AAN7C8J7_9PEZI|nr:hypothetical protein C8A03DRAFT_34786 [Achaetomium macrosporum]